MKVTLLHHVVFSPPSVLQSYQQHVADYVHLFMKEEEELTLGEH